MTPIDLLGLAAAALTTASFLPQAILVLRTRNTDGISLVMYLMFTSGVAIWVVYGALLKSIPLVAANTVTLLLGLCILGVKLQNVRRAANAP